MTRRHGFVRIDALDALVVLLTFIVLGLMLVLYFGRWHRRAARINCISNLKQIGVGFRLFANDNDGLLPEKVSQTNGGTLEIAATASSLAHFLAFSNELSNTKV